MEQDSLLSTNHVISQQESGEEPDPTLRQWRTETLIFLPIEDINTPYKEHILSMPQERLWLPYFMRNYQGFWQLEGILPQIMALQNHFKPRSSDIFIASYPKCGTTWLKALIFSVINRNKYNFDSHPLLRLNPHDCVKFLEPLFCDKGQIYLESLPSPRILSSHLAYSMLPESMRSSECKIVYICRDPKDALVSLWHMSKTLQADKSFLPFSEAFELFCNGRSLAGPIWKHVEEYWNESLRRPHKVLFLRYEEILADPLGSLKLVANFVGHPFTEDEEREGVGHKIVELCSFSKLTGLEVNKKQGGNKFDINHTFFRKGATGDWKNHLTMEMAERLDMITRLKLEGSGLILSSGHDPY